jgi:hypothetical protein
MEAKEMKLMFCSIPRHLFYQRGAISLFMLKKGLVPINPYMNFDYNLFSQLDKKTVRLANNNLVRFSDGMAVFMDEPENLTDGVLFEVGLAGKKEIKSYTVPDFKEHPGRIAQGGDVPYYGNRLKEKLPVIYTAISKHFFYYRMHISKYVLSNGAVPLNPFTLFDYFILDGAERKTIREANNRMVSRADELWVFGPVSDGVKEEIDLAEKASKKIRYFSIIGSKEIRQISKDEVEFEEEDRAWRHGRASVRTRI